MGDKSIGWFGQELLRKKHIWGKARRGVHRAKPQALTLQQRLDKAQAALGCT